MDKEIHKELRAIRNDIRNLRQDLNRYKGFVGGIMWIIAAMASAIGYALDWLRDQIT